MPTDQNYPIYQIWTDDQVPSPTYLFETGSGTPVNFSPNADPSDTSYQFVAQPNIAYLNSWIISNNDPYIPGYWCLPSTPIPTVFAIGTAVNTVGSNINIAVILNFFEDEPDTSFMELLGVSAGGTFIPSGMYLSIVGVNSLCVSGNPQKWKFTKVGSKSPRDPHGHNSGSNG